MLRFFIVFLVFCHQIGVSQELPEVFNRDENNKIVFSEVISVDSSQKAGELFLLSKAFLSKYYSSLKNVTIIDDNINNVIMTRGFQYLPQKDTSKFAMLLDKTKMFFTIKIESKKGRYKYSISDIEFDISTKDLKLPTADAETTFSKRAYYDKEGVPVPRKVKQKQDIEAIINDVIAKIKKAMSSEAAKSDW